MYFEKSSNVRVSFWNRVASSKYGIPGDLVVAPGKGRVWEEEKLQQGSQSVHPPKLPLSSGELISVI